MNQKSGAGRSTHLEKRSLDINHWTTRRNRKIEKKAEYQISSSVKEGIFEIILTGEVIESAAEKISNEVIAIIEENNIKIVLADVRALKGRFFTEAFFCVRDYPADIYRIKVAVVDNPQNANFQSFHEITAKKSGVSFKHFTNKAAARGWLKDNK
ncbi:MAG: hypothetical protein QMD11_13015 [Smithella sp.]|nr:hypothetical protein [Smithella sp.]